MPVDWRCAVIFIAALGLTTFGIGIGARYELHPATIGDVTDKLNAQPLARFDTIAIGSSRILHEFDPAGIATASARAGCTIDSYNLGIGGLNGNELRFLLRKIGEMRPPGLKRIVFDMPNHIHLQFANLNTRRDFVTTDPAQVPVAFEDILSHPDPRKFSALARYVIAFLYENSAIGTIAPLLAPTAAATAPAESLPLGYAALDAERASQTPEHLHLIANYPSFTRLIGRLREISLAADAPVAETARTRLRARIADGYIDLVKSFGYEPVLLLLPDTEPEAILDAAMLEAHVRAARPDVTVINLMSSAYADTVYEPSAWWDWTHLSAATVGRLSSGIGRALCEGPKDRQPVISEIRHALH